MTAMTRGPLLYGKPLPAFPRLGCPYICRYMEGQKKSKELLARIFFKLASSRVALINWLCERVPNKSGKNLGTRRDSVARCLTVAHHDIACLSPPIRPRIGLSSSPGLLAAWTTVRKPVELHVTGNSSCDMRYLWWQSLFRGDHYREDTGKTPATREKQRLGCRTYKRANPGVEHCSKLTHGLPDLVCDNIMLGLSNIVTS